MYNYLTKQIYITKNISLPLMVIIAMCLRIKNPTNINNNITSLKNCRIPSPFNDSISILWEHFKHGTGQNFITVKFPVMCADYFTFVHFLFSAHWQCAALG